MAIALLVKGHAPFKCPMCRAVFEIPTVTAAVNEENQAGKVTTFLVAASSLPINHFASTVLAAASSPSSSSLSKGHVDPNNVMCEICEENQAIEYCKECSQSFCAMCKKPHLKAKVSAHHRFILLDEAVKLGSGGGSASRITRCEKHPQQEINTYCQVDKQAICFECIFDFHQEHKIERLVNVVQEFKEISQLADKVCSSLSCYPSCFFVISLMAGV